MFTFFLTVGVDMHVSLVVILICISLHYDLTQHKGNKVTYTCIKHGWMSAHTNRILSMVANSLSWDALTRVIGSVHCSILKFLSLPITHSTWILTLDSVLTVSTSFCESWDFPFVKGGITREAPQRARGSVMSNPQSTRSTSPCINLSRNLLCAVMCLLLARPPQHSVLWCL